MSQLDPAQQNQTAPAIDAAGGVAPGIYLEEKKSSIGTGNTAKTAEYRSFWVTLDIRERDAEMLLLDDDFKPTGIRKSISLETLSGPGWHFIAEGEKRYQRLKPLLERLQAAAAPKPAAQAAPKSANWWDGGGGGGEPKDPFALDKKPKASSAPKKGGWWEK
ncbi:MAG: hypothetical protein LBV79_05580 [Candidatus Adiutrix sp.]|jgi:hypothetical protein|nr:hypothetical protein [Candidatus Adiutrix sp.]